MRALICGIRGQDGSLLAKFLLNKGYEVIGTSRDVVASPFENLKILGIDEKVKKVSMVINDFRSVIDVVKTYKPDEIYNLSGQTSVGLSFHQPVEAMESIAKATLVLLEVIRFLDFPIRFYNAGSGECFGDTGGIAANEKTLFKPCSPYAVAKASAHWLIKNYRDAYGIPACTGILFNHESQLRPQRFVTQKIVKGAWNIKNGRLDRLKIGNISIYRDWGWAPEYVNAMWLMLQQEKFDDFIIATGKSHSLKEFIEKTFNYFDLDFQKYIDLDEELIRPSEIFLSKADPSYAEKKLKWKANTQFDQLIKNLCEYCINREII